MHYMKLLLSSLLCLASIMANGQTNSNQPEWQNETIVDRGKEKPHAWFLLPERLSLDGTWRFHFEDDVSKAPVDFYLQGYDDSRWNRIKVPSNWELEGFGHPIFINFKYKWTPNPPYIDIPNPIGLYRTTFTVPANMHGKNLILHFGSIAGYARVYVNGKEVGMTKSSKTPAEFDITRYVGEGSNLLAVEVLKYHDGSYMEDQDFWRLAGIERNVYIQAYKPLSVWDYEVSATPINNYKDGKLNVKVYLREFQHDMLSAKSLAVRLVNTETSKPVYSSAKTLADHNLANPIVFSSTINNVDLWCSETPNLYELQILLNGDTIRQNVGFREVKIVGPRLLVNGKPIYIKGVNRHETNDSLGHVPTIDIMMHDIKKMKSLNINAVRSCHYPDDPRWLDVCDKYGLYVIDEANIETHGMGSVPYFNDTTRHPAYLPSWIPAHIDRIHRMYYRDRNHPSIIGWSLGNECGNGEVFKQQYKWLKQQDSTRYVQFEQAWEDWNTDVVALMYPNFNRMKAYAKSGKQRPFIMCEYAHAQGNGNGNLQELWDVIKSSPNMQGGYIWDFQDQGFKMQRNENDDHRTYYMYNGGMGSYVWPDDENSGTDGIIASDGTEKPQAYEVKKVYQDINFSNFDWKTGKLTVRNELFFTKLDQYVFRYAFHRMGEKVGEGTFSLSTSAQDSSVVKLRMPKTDNAELTLEVYACLKKKTSLLPAGHEVAREQYVAGDWQQGIAANHTHSSDSIAIEIDQKSGMIKTYKINGNSVFEDWKGPEPYFWRPPTDNDFGNNMPQKMGLWRQLQTNRKVEKCTITETEEGKRYDFDMMLTDISQPYKLTYVVRSDGSIRVVAEMNTTGRKNLPEMPRFAMRFVMPQGFENVSYYGRGPLETTTDRKSSQFIGKYENTVTGLHYSYIRPQFNGYHADTRSLSITNPQTGTTMTIDAVDTPFGFTALHYSDEDLDPGLTRKMQHAVDLLPRRNTHVVIDNVQRGVGGDNSWGELPHNEYRHWDGKYKLEMIYRLSNKESENNKK